MLLVVLGIFFQPTPLWAQEEPEDIALDNDEFQNYFYESLKQKGIENYDKAIAALKRCEKLQPNNSVVYYELGKNHFSLKEYPVAYENFEKATQLDSSNRWYWVGLYEVAFAIRDYALAIQHLEKLITFKKDYKEELVKVYMTTQKYDQAIALIQELEETIGKSEQRNQYKAQIKTLSKHKGQNTTDLEAEILKHPEEESNYIALIYLYSEANQLDKAFEVAKELEKKLPTSDWAQISLFKFHLDKKDFEKASSALEKIVSSPQIERRIKHRAFNEFLIYAKDHSSHVATLDKLLVYFYDDKEIRIAKELGKFYQNKANWFDAIKYYEKELQSNPEDVENRLLLSQVYLESKKFESLADLSHKSLELFPLQPDFYYFAGLANNQLKQHKKARELLAEGLDYIVDNPKMEINFYIQLGEACHAMGDIKNKDQYFLKAEQRLKQVKQ